MIKPVPVIKINNTKHPVSSLDFGLGGPGSPSEMSISFANIKDTKFAPSEFDVGIACIIEVGSFFTFRGFQVSYAVNTSSSGKEFSVTYRDFSVRLDRLFIGLAGVHGPSYQLFNKKGESVGISPTIVGSSNNPNLILLGSYVDPCSLVEEDKGDPCDPCLPSIDELNNQALSNTRKLIDCINARRLDILEVRYTFQEFYNKLIGAGFIFTDTSGVTFSFDQQYLQADGNFTGTAREVLDSWLQEFGLTFYWNSEKDSIVIVNLAKGISITDETKDKFKNSVASLISKSESKSIADVSTNGFVYYFQTQGALKQYDCSKQHVSLLSLSPVTLYELFFSVIEGESKPDARLAHYSKGQGSPVDNLQLLCMLSKRSKVLRDLITLYHFYEAREINSGLEGKSFPLLGMKILEVFRPTNQADALDGGNLREQDLLKFYGSVPPEIRELISKNGGAVCKIQYLKELYDKHHEMESDLANNFIGKYWMSSLRDGHKYQMQSPDGSPVYIDTRNDAINSDSLPFSSFVSDNRKKLFLKDILGGTKAKNKTPDENPQDISNGFVLLDRQANYFPKEPIAPLKDSDSVFEESLDAKLQPYHFYTIDPAKLSNSSSELGEFYIIMFDCPESEVEKGFKDNPIEKKNVNIIKDIEAEKTINGNYSNQKKKLAYGLQGAQSVSFRYKISFRGMKGDVGAGEELIGPAQALASSSEGAGYRITLEKKRDDEHKFILDKKEILDTRNLPQPTNLSTSFRVNVKDLSAIAKNIIISPGTSENKAPCEFDEGKIKQILANYPRVTTENPVAETFSFNIIGFPSEKFTYADGLTSFSVRMNSQDGFSTSLSFANMLPRNKSESLVDKDFEKNKAIRQIPKSIPASKNSR